MHVCNATLLLPFALTGLTLPALPLRPFPSPPFSLVSLCVAALRCAALFAPTCAWPPEKAVDRSLSVLSCSSSRSLSLARSLSLSLASARPPAAAALLCPSHGGVCRPQGPATHAERGPRPRPARPRRQRACPRQHGELLPPGPRLADRRQRAPPAGARSRGGGWSGPATKDRRGASRGEEEREREEFFQPLSLVVLLLCRAAFLPPFLSARVPGPVRPARPRQRRPPSRPALAALYLSLSLSLSRFPLGFRAPPPLLLCGSTPACARLLARVRRSPLPHAPASVPRRRCAVCR